MDLIDRQAAIDAMTNTLWHYPNECYRNLSEYEFAKGLAELGLKSVPSAQPEVLACGSGELNVQSEPHWIQCSETVDIPDHEILACDKYGEVMFGYLAYEDDQWLCVSDDCMMYDPIAWREKPEPYRGRR